MQVVVVLIGGLILSAGLVGFAKPDALMNVIKQFAVRPALVWCAAALRVAIGVVFLIAAPETRWPGFIQFFGWFAIAVGLITPLFIGRLDAWVAWWTSRPPAVMRAMYLVALALGGAVVIAGT